MTEILLISGTDIATVKQLPSTTIKSERVNPYILEAQRFDLRELIGYPMYAAIMNAYRGATSPYSNENLFIDYGSLAVSVFTVGETVNGMDGVTVKATGKMVSDGSGRIELSTLTGTWDDAVTLKGVTSLTTATISTLNYGKYYLLMNGETYTDNYNYTVDFLGLKIALCYWAFARLVQNQQVTFTDNSIVEKTNQYSQGASSTKIANLISQARAGATAMFNTAEKYMNDKNIDTVTYRLWLDFCKINSRKSGGFKMVSVDRERDYDYRTRELNDSGFGASTDGSIRRLRLTTTLDGVQYTIPQLSGKTSADITLVQYENVVLTPDQYTLVGTTFTITDVDMQVGFILAGKYLNIQYEV